MPAADTLPIMMDSLSQDNYSLLDIISGDTITAAEEILEVVTDSLSATDSSLDSLRNMNASRQGVSRINRGENDLKSVVEFSAKDSLLLIGSNNAYLYGESEVEYGEFKLNSANIEMQLDSATVAATGVRDSLGNLTGNPVFTEKQTTYESKTMR